MGELIKIITKKDIQKRILFGLLIIGIFYYLILSLKTMSDFKVYYKSAQRIINSEELYRYEDGFYMYKYPPFFAFSIMPISFLPIDTAKVIWLFYMSICFVLSIIFTQKLIIDEKINSRLFYFLPIFFTSKFILEEFHLGQINIITFFYTVLGLYFIFKKPKYEWLGGIFAAYAIIIKVTPLIFLPYLLFRKKFIGLISCAFFSILFFLMPVLNYGWDNFFRMTLKWREVVGAYYYDQIYNPSNQSIFGIFYRFFTPNEIVKNQILNLSPFLINAIIVLILSILYILLIFPIFFNKQKNTDLNNNSSWTSYDRNALILLFVYMTLFSPHGFMANYFSSIPAYMFLFYYSLKNHFALSKASVVIKKNAFTYFLIAIIFMFTVFFNYETVGRYLDTLFMSYSSIGLSIILLVVVIHIIIFNECKTVK
ncbi:DUF2029 domain-containing protein [Candidatus Poribacteria bacterium]|nr:DUF2029 domain-containing protein [Candidatus Poribacteria bacterium]